MSKKLLLIILIPAVLLIGGYLYLRISLQASINKEEEQTGKRLPVTDTLGGKQVSAIDLRPLFIKRLQLLLKKSSDGLYDLSIGDLKIDVLASTLLLKKVMMQPDTVRLAVLKKNNQLPGDIFSISFDSLLIEGINIDDAITSKTMDYKLVKMTTPVITIHHQKTTKKPNDTTSFSYSFLKEMEKLSIKKLIVEEGIVSIYNDAKKSPPNKLNHVSVTMDDVLIDSSTRNDKDRFLFAKEASVSMRNYSRPTADGMYLLKIGELKIKAPQQQLQLSEFSFTSPFSKDEFVKKQKWSKELYHVTFPSITIDKVDWWRLLNEEEVVADEVRIKKGSVSIFLDRSLPPKSRMGNFPNQLLMKMPMKWDIKKINITDLDFSYGEYNPLSQQSGTVYLDHINLTVANLSNEGGNDAKQVIINGDALFMHKVPVKAGFNFDMKNANSGNFTAHIKMEGFDGALVNSFTVPMGLMKIEKGTVQSAEGTVKGNQWKANGEVFIPYQDLKLSLMEKDKGETKLDKKGFTSFVANLFVLKKDNPKEGKSSRKENAEFKRIPEGGFFMLVWKTILVGILKTIGAPQKLAYKTISTPKK